MTITLYATTLNKRITSVLFGNAPLVVKSIDLQQTTEGVDWDAVVDQQVAVEHARRVHGHVLDNASNDEGISKIGCRHSECHPRAAEQEPPVPPDLMRNWSTKEIVKGHDGRWNLDSCAALAT